jgi:hypothetical protein
MRGDHFGRVSFSGMAIIFCDDEGRSFWESQFLGNSDPVLMRFRMAIILGESIFGE